MISYKCLGLMSGTSLDGLDICYAEFIFDNQKWSYKILEAITLPYSIIWENRLRNSTNISSIELQILHKEYGDFLAKACFDFINKHNISHLDVISSHGHTVFHQPQNGFTTQIGNGLCIKLKTGFTTVFDFRNQDVLLGGQGAPLIPIGDALLFSEFDACLNIGGFANISFEREGERLAYDICPTNIVINNLTKQLGFNYDENGVIASRNNVDFYCLEKLNALSFYHKNPPKSLGVEWVLKNINPLLEGLSLENAISTFTYHSSHQIASEFNKKTIKNVLVTGGGAYNSFLIESIKSLTNTKINLGNSELIEFKEALVFAFMGLLKTLNLTNVIASTTGSRYSHSSGIIV